MGYHSAFTTENGINEIMCIYEQLVMEVENTDIVIQHDGKKPSVAVVYRLTVHKKNG